MKQSALWKRRWSKRILWGLFCCSLLGGLGYGGRHWVEAEMEESFFRALALRKELSIKEWSGELIREESAVVYVANRSFFLIHLSGNEILTHLDEVVVEFFPNTSKRFPYGRVELNSRDKEGDGGDTETSAVRGGGATATPITSDGYFLTNAHVVEKEWAPFYLWGPTERGLRLASVRVVWRGDHGHNDLPDLALLHADMPPSDHFPFERGELPPLGDRVIVGGYGGMAPNQAAGRMLEHGIWRKWNSDTRWRAFIHDAALHPGDSGGPVTSRDGELIGINALIHGNRQWPRNNLKDYQVRALQPDRHWMLQLIAADRAERRLAAFADFSESRELYEGVSKPVFVNSLGMRFYSVPLPFEGGEESVLLFAQYETRLGDFRHYAEREAGDRALGEPVPKWSIPRHDDTDEHPVTFVSWHEARAFCEWLTSRERESGLIGPEDRYRLPTDHEWSCAVGIGHLENAEHTPKEKHLGIRDLYPWGVDWPPSTPLGNYRGPETEAETVAETLPDGHKQAAAAGSFPLTHWGLSDLGGNVWEWCEDSWHHDEEEVKTARGAAFSTENKMKLHSSARRPCSSSAEHGDVGFRVVLDE